MAAAAPDADSASLLDANDMDPHHQDCDVCTCGGDAREDATADVLLCYVCRVFFHTACAGVKLIPKQRPPQPMAWGEYTLYSYLCHRCADNRDVAAVGHKEPQPSRAVLVPRQVGVAGHGGRACLVGRVAVLDAMLRGCGVGVASLFGDPPPRVAAHMLSRHLPRSTEASALGFVAWDDVAAAVAADPLIDVAPSAAGGDAGGAMLTFTPSPLAAFPELAWRWRPRLPSHTLRPSHWNVKKRKAEVQRFVKLQQSRMAATDDASDGDVRMASCDKRESSTFRHPGLQDNSEPAEHVWVAPSLHGARAGPGGDTTRPGGGCRQQVVAQRRRTAPGGNAAHLPRPKLREYTIRAFGEPTQRVTPHHWRYLTAAVREPDRTVIAPGVFLEVRVDWCVDADAAGPFCPRKRRRRVAAEDPVRRVCEVIDVLYDTVEPDTARGYYAYVRWYWAAEEVRRQQTEDMDDGGSTQASDDGPAHRAPPCPGIPGSKFEQLNHSVLDYCASEIHERCAKRRAVDKRRRKGVRMALRAERLKGHRMAELPGFPALDGCDGSDGSPPAAPSAADNDRRAMAEWTRRASLLAGDPRNVYSNERFLTLSTSIIDLCGLQWRPVAVQYVPPPPAADGCGTCMAATHALHQLPLGSRWYDRPAIRVAALLGGGRATDVLAAGLAAATALVAVVTATQRVRRGVRFSVSPIVPQFYDPDRLPEPLSPADTALLSANGGRARGILKGKAGDGPGSAMDLLPPPMPSPAAVRNANGGCCEAGVGGAAMATTPVLMRGVGGEEDVGGPRPCVLENELVLSLDSPSPSLDGTAVRQGEETCELTLNVRRGTLGDAAGADAMLLAMPPPPRTTSPAVHGLFGVNGSTAPAYGHPHADCVNCLSAASLSSYSAGSNSVLCSGTYASETTLTQTQMSSQGVLTTQGCTPTPLPPHLPTQMQTQASPPPPPPATDDRPSPPPSPFSHASAAFDNVLDLADDGRGSRSGTRSEAMSSSSHDTVSRGAPPRTAASACAPDYFFTYGYNAETSGFYVLPKAVEALLEAATWDRQRLQGGGCAPNVAGTADDVRELLRWVDPSVKKGPEASYIYGHPLLYRRVGVNADHEVCVGGGGVDAALLRRVEGSAFQRALPLVERDPRTPKAWQHRSRVWKKRLERLGIPIQDADLLNEVWLGDHEVLEEPWAKTSHVNFEEDRSVLSAPGTADAPAPAANDSTLNDVLRVLMRKDNVETARIRRDGVTALRVGDAAAFAALAAQDAAAGT